MQQRVDRASADAEVEARELGDARQKNVHFSARVIALNSRLQSLQRQLREAAARETALLADLEAVRRAAAVPAADRTGDQTQQRDKLLTRLPCLISMELSISSAVGSPGRCSILPRSLGALYLPLASWQNTSCYGS